MSKVNPVAPISKFGIVNRVAVILNLGDYAKVESFVEKVVKTLTRETDSLHREIGNARHNYKSAKSELDEKLEDAEASLEEAYTSIDPAYLKTNEAQRAYMEDYLENIDEKELAVRDVKSDIKELEEEFNEKLAELKAEIAVRKVRIDKMSATD